MFHQDNTMSHESAVNRQTLQELVANKNQVFYESGIMKLPIKCQQFVEKNGEYAT